MTTFILRKLCFHYEDMSLI